MSSWKKVIVSGSDAELNSLDISTSLTASGITYPTVDGVLGQFIITDGAGNLSFSNIENTTITVKNVSGSPISKGTPCYITASGTSGNIAGVIPADAGNPSLMPAGVIANEALNDGDEGIGLINGFISNVPTSLFNPGDSVYVAVGGGYTNVRPTGSSVLIQKLGNVEKSHPSNGSGVINGPGYYNDLPNVQSGYTWVGNNDGVATSIATSSIQNVVSSQTASYINPLVQNVIITGSLIISASGATNDFRVGDSKLFISVSGRVGIGTSSPSSSLHVNSQAQPSTGESIARFTVSDADGTLAITNNGTADGVYQPAIVSQQASTVNTTGFLIRSQIGDDTGGSYAMIFEARSGSASVVSTRPLFQWRNNTTPYMVMDATGSVGIGITSPTSKLHINNTSAGNSFLVEDSTNPDTTPFIIDSAGLVGIGTTTPTSLLTVSASGVNGILLGTNTGTGLQEQSSRLMFGSITASNTVTMFAQSGSLVIYTGGTPNVSSGTVRMLVSSSGNVGIGTSTSTVSARLHVNNTSTDNSFLVEDSSQADSSPFVIDTDGNVGIGKLSPNTTLDVIGSVLITGSLVTSGSSVVQFKSIPKDTKSYIIYYDEPTGALSYGSAGISPTASYVNPLTQSVNITGSLTVTGSFDASSYSNKIIAITELTSSALVTHTVGTTNFTAINLNSDATNRYAKASFVAPLSGKVQINMEFDMTIVNSAAVQMIGLHNTSSATTTPSEGWYRINADNDSTSGQFYATFIKTGLTPGTTYNYYFMGVCNFSGNTVRISNLQTGAYSAGSDLPAPLRIYVYDLGNALITSNPSS